MKAISHVILWNIQFCINNSKALNFVLLLNDELPKCDYEKCNSKIHACW